ncbi:pathogenesis-related protein 10-like [Vigna unguiculata]|uniref:pathogenesis-related protein 10-like n=1 Tax=Vigna unguiculata TaxID=3917 RepID=UPI0010161FC9|nr:pathogenesis-related protein 10-like [Vigna unguiculata]
MANAGHPSRQPPLLYKDFPFHISYTNTNITVMGVFTQVYDTPAAVPPARLFKAMTLDFHNLFPKLVDTIHSIEFTQGNGGPGTIKKITTIQGEESKYVLHRVDAIDEGSFVYNFSIIDGSGLPETLEKISFESQLVEGSNGGTIRKVHATYFTKGEAVLSEEELKANQAKIQGLVKLVEGYLLANPHY